MAAAPSLIKKKKEVKEQNPLFEKRSKNFGIGNFLCSYSARAFVQVRISSLNETLLDSSDGPNTFDFSDKRLFFRSD